jgi:hypothetical protein
MTLTIARGIELRMLTCSYLRKDEWEKYDTSCIDSYIEVSGVYLEVLRKILRQKPGVIKPRTSRISSCSRD